jgi:5-methylthioadenosine/S-adenosylhomocysteine deaminase
MRLDIRGADLVTPQEIFERGSLKIRDGRIVEAGPSGASGAGPFLDGAGLTAFPGLINAHEHLLGTWSPRAGRGPYRNVYDWLAEYHPHPVRQEKLRVPDPLVFGLGGYRNLLAGVTTVVDHDRRRDPSQHARVPVRAFTDFGREWVLRSVTDPARYPPWGRGIAEELREAAGLRPFIIHAAEGLDPESAAEVDRLIEMGALGPNTILVHAIGLDAEDLQAVARAGATVVWCPESNHFLYGETADVKILRDTGVRVCLGTDSSSTGSAHLLEELKVARKTWTARYGRPLDPSALVAMVTSEPAAALGRAGAWGTLAPGAEADVLLVDVPGPDPHARLLDAEPRDVDLLLLGGVPVFGSARREALFRESGTAFTAVSVGGREKFAAGDLPGLLREIRAILGFEKKFHFLPEGL